MRPIKFRGLRVDGKGWVYGDLTGGNTIHVDTSWYDFDTCQWWGVEVRPETVGQFIGREDVNGADIYEGDEVYAWDDGAEKGEGSSDSGFIEYAGNSFCLKTEGVSNANWVYAEFCEVIGNIHENQPIND